MSLKPGFFDHHTEDCDIEFRYESIKPRQPCRAYFCKTHNQWCYEFPVATTFEWDNGETTKVEHKARPGGGVEADQFHAKNK